MAIGRPSLFTEARVKVIIKLITDGNTRVCAAKSAGISPALLYEWIAAGRKGDPAFVDFVERLDKADGDAESTAVAELRLGMMKSWQAAIAWLDRRRPQHWRPKERTVEQLLEQLKTLPPEHRRMVADALYPSEDTGPRAEGIAGEPAPAKH